MSYHVTSLISLLLVVRVCRSNLGNKRTRFTHSHHRMAHTLRHFCSCSSIGTDTRCCSNGAGFLFDITFCRWIAAVGAGSANPKPRSVSSRPLWRDLGSLLFCSAVFNLVSFVVYSFCSLSSSFFHRVNHRSPPVGAKGKEPKRPAHGLSKSLKALVREDFPGRNIGGCCYFLF